MKCPYCEYTDGWNSETLEIDYGKKGSFYILSNNIKMRRNLAYGKDKLELIGCPACKKVFMKGAE